MGERKNGRAPNAVDLRIGERVRARRVEIGSFTLARPLEAVWIDDHRFFHGVTAVHPKVAGTAARRDVLVLTLKKRTEDSSAVPLARDSCLSIALRATSDSSAVPAPLGAA